MVEKLKAHQDYSTMHPYALGCKALNEAPDDLRKAVAIGGLGVSLGIPIAKIVAWIGQYGVPMLSEVLMFVQPMVGNTPEGVALQFIEMALQALQAGQPMPPLPTKAEKKKDDDDDD